GSYPLYAIWPTTATVSANPPNPAAGASTTLTAVIDSAGKGPAMTGYVIFNGNPESIGGAPTYTVTTDASGNSVMQATLSYTPAVNHETVSAQYSGDIDYGSSSSSTLAIAVAGTDFKFTAPSSLTVAVPGGSNTMLLTIDGQASYTGPATFACTGLPAESTCSFSPASLAGSGTSTLSVTTTGSHTVSSVRKDSGRGSGWMGGIVAAFVGILLIGGSKQGRAKVLLGFMAITLLLPVVSCGGGGSGGEGSGHVDPGTPAGSYTVTVTATGGGISHTVTFTLSIG
ncbi:MAG TPA: hypothetical protein VMH85_19015, partial [Terriglobales bacterium]|nr:hypothetical protein [Terriglobales bacterium]